MKQFKHPDACVLRMQLVCCLVCGRNLTLEAACSGALDAQYGRAAAAIIRSRLMEHPARLAINAIWDSKVDGEQVAEVLHASWLQHLPQLIGTASEQLRCSSRGSSCF